MGKTLVITEKKSVADDFARVLGGFETRSDRYEGDSMVIAWASGHLLELARPQVYRKEWRFWSLEALPMVPETFQHVPREADGKAATLLARLVKLMQSPTVTEIINACDAGREGELIFNLIAEHAGNSKPVKRLWLQSMTASAIRSAFEHLAPSSKFANLRDAAFARDQADWLVGMNGTRALTKRFLGRTGRYPLAVGRVKTPTLAVLVDRERDIDRFIPEPYFEIRAVLDTGSGTFEANWYRQEPGGGAVERLTDRAAVEAVVARTAGKTGTASDTVKETTDQPPLLFDLTSLQRAASSAFGYTLRRTLSIVQTLYEAKKAVTYPRTSSRYLPKDYAKETPGIIDALVRGRYASLGRHLNPDRRATNFGAVFNDAKVSDHFALIPTGEIPQSLRDDERKIYEMIVRRFLAVFAPVAVWEKTSREAEIEGERFRASARHLRVPGWRAIEGADEDEPLPVLGSNRSVTAREVRIEEKATTPPRRFTDGTLVGEMETAGKHVEDEELVQALKEKGIGTPATRAAIVEDLIYKGLARRDRRTLLPTPLGCTLVRLVRNLAIDALAKPDMTGEWEYHLKRMVDGEYARSRFDAEIRDLVDQIVGAVKGAEDGTAVFLRDHPPGIVCPKCRRPIIEKAYSYYCADEEGCGLRWNKDASGKNIFPEVLARLFANREVGPLTGFERLRVPSRLRLADDFSIDVVPEAGAVEEAPEAGDEAVQVEEVPDGTVMGRCPECRAADVIAKGAAYACTAEGCKFRLGRKILFRTLPPDEVRKMLSGEKTGPIAGFISRRGKRFTAHLSFDEKGKLVWAWPERKTAEGGAKGTKTARVARSAKDTKAGGKAAEEGRAAGETGEAPARKKKAGAAGSARRKKAATRGGLS